jgi:hypothetical protein
MTDLSSEDSDKSSMPRHADYTPKLIAKVLATNLFQ